MLIDFAFEELALRTLPDGSEGLPADGIATIDCGREGPWVVTAIKLRYRKLRAGEVIRTHALIDKGDRDAQRIEMVLLTDPDWHAQVQERVDAALRSEDLEDRRFHRAYTRQLMI